MIDIAEAIVVIVVATLRAGTPLVLAGLGELITEKSGVLNLGVEGMMLVGAVAAIIVTLGTGSYLMGALAGTMAGVAMSLVFGLLTLSLRANQVAAGLALTIFGVGLSAFLGLAYRDKPLEGLKELAVPGLSDIPVIGPLLFGHDIFVYFSLVLYAAVAWFLARSRGALVLKAVGEAPEAAHALGHNVLAVRYAATAFGGALAGLAGSYLTLVYTPMWADNLTAGRGWIALALVVFATWRPSRLLLGAYLFGGITIAQLHLQASGGTAAAWTQRVGASLDLPTWLVDAVAQALEVLTSPHLLSMLPYVATIVVLVLIARDATRIKLNAPAALGKPFEPGR